MAGIINLLAMAEGFPLVSRGGVAGGNALLRPQRSSPVFTPSSHPRLRQVGTAVANGSANLSRVEETGAVGIPSGWPKERRAGAE